MAESGQAVLIWAYVSGKHHATAERDQPRRLCLVRCIGHPSSILQSHKCLAILPRLQGLVTGRSV